MPLKSALRSPASSPPLERRRISMTTPAGSERPTSATSASLSRPSTATSTTSATTTSSSFIPRVSFDATQAASGSHGGGTGIEQSFTLRATTAGFVRSRESRTFLVATDLNEYSLHALHWSLDRLIEDNDEIVVLRVLDPSSSSSSVAHASVSEQAREEAHMLIRSVTERNSYVPPASSSSGAASGQAQALPLREIGITVEFVIGKVQESIQKMITVYRPDSLIVGTRGRSDSIFKNAFIGSVSKYCVANSPIPVIVVRPAIKVRKMQGKREGRQSYLDLVEGPGSASAAAASASASGSSESIGKTHSRNLFKSSTMPVESSDTHGSILSRFSSRPTTSSGTDSPIRGAPLTQTKTMS